MRREPRVKLQNLQAGALLRKVSQRDHGQTVFFAIATNALVAKQAVAVVSGRRKRLFCLPPVKHDLYRFFNRELGIVQ